MNTKALRTILPLLLALFLLFSVCACATAGTVTVYTNPNAKIILDGQPVNLLDILMKDGTAYVPLMQLAKLMGKEVTWSQENQAFYVGTQPGGMDLIDVLKPYTSDNAYVYSSEQDKKIEIANKTYTKYIVLAASGIISGEIYYNLEGKYKTLQFYTYSDSYSTKKLKVFGDNNSLLYSAEVVSKQLPQLHTVDVNNVYQLKFEVDSPKIYLLEPIAK